MKAFIAVLAGAALSGCAVYPGYPVASGYAGYGAGVAPAYVEQPGYVYGAGGYGYGYGGYASPYVYRYPQYYHRGFNHIRPGGFPGHGPRPYFHGPRPGGGVRNPGHYGHR